MNRLHRQDPVSANLRAAPRRVRRAAQSLVARPNAEPVFILGHQKSGTSAVAALLGELTGLSVTIDLINEDRRPSYLRVTSGEMTFDRLVRRNRLDFSSQIVKEPNLTFFYPQLVERFPDARFAIVVRDPRTNAKSILDRLGLPGRGESIPAEQDRKLRHGWRLAFDPAWLGLDGGTYIDVLAQRWNRCADVYLGQPKAMRLLRYEDFRADKLGALEGLAGDLGLTCRNNIRDHLDRQFQPAGNRSVGVEEFFGVDNLARIESACESRMRAFGYEPVSALESR